MVNGSGILATDVKISTNASIEPLYLSQERHSKFLNATNGIGGSVNLTYFLSGVDYLKVFTVNEKSPVSGNFGGLYFTSGYLKSYDLSCSPNNPIIVNVEIVHFDALSGSFVRTTERSTGTNILNFCDAIITDTSNDGRGDGIGKISGISNIQFSFNSDIAPLYLAGDQMPSDIRFGKKELMAVFTSDMYSGDLPVTGKPAGVLVTFKHPELPNLTESFGVSGVLFRRDIDTSVGNLIKARYYIKQAFAAPIPGLSSVSDLNATPGDSITINGTNLLSTRYVYFANMPADILSASNTQLSVTVPTDVVSGDIQVVTDGGIAKIGLFTPTFPALTVDKLNPVSGEVSGSIFISGSNFYGITDVMFSTTAPGLWTGSSGFVTINSTTIVAPVPVDAAWGPVLVMATGQGRISQSFLLIDSTNFILQEDGFRILLDPISTGLSGQSVEKFVPIPSVYGFSPSSGMSGDAIIISGQGFSGVTGVLFNNLPNIVPFTVAVTSGFNTGIRVIVPTGNVRGPIKILVQSGISATSVDSFSPYASLTGITPVSGRTGTAITLLGHNMFPDIMYSLGNDSFAVTFPNGVTGVFFRTQFAAPNFTGLTGLIPYGAKSGIIGINYNSASVYPSNTTFQLIHEPPTITGINPKSGTYSGYIDVLGTNFYDIFDVQLSGLGRAVTLTDPTPIANSSADVVTFRVPVLTPRLTGDVYKVIIRTTISGNVTGEGSNGLTILDAPIFSGFTGRLLGTSGAWGDKITVTGKNIYIGSQIFLPYSGLSGESGVAFIDSGSFNSTNSQISFYVPQSARTGLSNIILYNGIDYASGVSFKLINRPTISGFSPTSGEWGTGISISGTFLSNVTGIRIGTGVNASFTFITDTGLNFTVPEDTYSDIITISSLAGSSSSTGVFANNIPLPIFSGFTPTRAFSGDQLILSGSRLHTIDAILFTGGSNFMLFDYRYFTKVGSTGINLPVPGGITSGQITLRAPRGLVTSAAFFEPFLLPSINGFTPTFGAHNDSISVTGSNLSGTFVWFISPNSGKYVSGLSQATVGTTGITCTVPREITVGPIIVSGSGRVWAASSQNFIPLPTISGFSPTTVQSGNTFVITGINATRVLDILLITGNHKFWNCVSGTFTRNLTNASGSNIVNQTTGYSLYTVTIDSEFITTGRIFLINDFYSGIITGADNFLTSPISGTISNVISTQTLTVSETAPII